MANRGHAAPGGDFMDLDGPDLQRQRLPTLLEVLSRRTLSPVDLFAFYIYMRDQQRSVDYLDFWLDVSQHMSLCRHYVRELRRSVLLETPELEKTGSKRSSQILNSFDLLRNGDSNSNEAGPAGSLKSNITQDQRLSAFLRTDAASTHSPSSSDHKGSSDSRDSSPNALPTATKPNGEKRPTTSETQRTGRSGEGNTRTPPPRPSFMSSALAASSSQERYSSSGHGTGTNQDSTPQHTIQRGDIRASAEKILYTYLLPGSEREIILPQQIVHAITEDIESHGRDDPEVFDDAKEYVYQAMERDAFPGFLRSKALGNLVPPSLMLRLIIGLLAMFAGFWAAFILIFTDASRQRRCALIVPFSIGVYALASHQYTLDPILALLGLSELTFFSFARVKEAYVKSLLRKRALVVLSWAVFITACVCVLFIFVPGHYL